MMDIKPLGFNVIEMDGYVTDRVIEEIKAILQNPDSYKERAEKNFQLAKRFFSYEVVRRKLRTILINFEGIVEAIDSRID